MSLQSRRLPFILKRIRIKYKTKTRRLFNVFVVSILIMILYAIIGGLSTLALVIGIPAIIIWKIYRKAVLHISMFD